MPVLIATAGSTGDEQRGLFVEFSQYRSLHAVNRTGDILSRKNLEARQREIPLYP